MYRRNYPCKQGVKVYGLSKAGSWFVPVTGRDADWKLFPWDPWQVRRSDFDRMMLEQAVMGFAVGSWRDGLARLRDHAWWRSTAGGRHIMTDKDPQFYWLLLIVFATIALGPSPERGPRRK